MNIVIGTANFLNKYGLKNNKIQKKEIKKIFKYCKKNKLLSFDTAFSYDDFKNINDVKFDTFKISSKLNFDNNLNSYTATNEYLKLLTDRTKEFGIKYFDRFFIHNFDELSKKDLIKVMDIMKLFKKKKLINKIGISIYDEKSLTKISSLGSIDIIQAPLSLCDRRFIKKKYIDLFKKKNIKFQARSIFLQGLLLHELKDSKKKFIDKNFLKNFKKWLNKNKMLQIQACLNFIKNQTFLDSIVIGIENLDQLREIIYFLKSKNNNKYPKKLISNKKIFYDPRKW